MLDWQIPFSVQHAFGRAVVNVRHSAWFYLSVLAVFSLAWLCWRRWPQRRPRLQAGAVGHRQIGREMLTSVVSIVILSNVVPLLFLVGLGRYTQFYRHVAERGWIYFFVSIALMAIIQDTYFYWTHRAMHHRRLFRWFHRTHHRSTNPNPWSTYAISPLEAVVDSLSGVLILALIPTTGLALLTFTWINTAYAVYAHLGYELLPAGTGQHWLGRWINTSVAHNDHHAKARYNYGWYFLFWDRMMGTLDPMYAQRFRQRVTIGAS